MILTLIIFGWMACGLLAGSLCIGDFERYDYPIPVGLVANLVLMGPAGVLVALCVADQPYRLGWRLK